MFSSKEQAPDLFLFFYDHFICGHTERLSLIEIYKHTLDKVILLLLLLCKSHMIHTTCQYFLLYSSITRSNVPLYDVLLLRRMYSVYVAAGRERNKCEKMKPPPPTAAVYGTLRRLYPATAVS